MGSKYFNHNTSLLFFNQKASWKPTPISLKIISSLITLKILISLIKINSTYELGTYLFGISIYGNLGLVIFITLKIITPAILLFAIYNRNYWGARFGILYLSFLILNNVMSGIITKETSLIISTLELMVFLIVIYIERDYFE